MITLAPEDFAIAPARQLGDRAVRLDDLELSHGVLSRDGRTLALWTRSAVVELDDEQWATRAVHRHDRATRSRSASEFTGPILAYTRADGEVTLCNTRGDRRRFAAPSFADGTVIPALAPDELYVRAPRSLTRLRFDGGSLRVEATYAWPEERRDFGFELRELAFAPDATSLYALTDRDIIVIDCETLRPIEPSVLFDVNTHNGDPRAWIETQSLGAMTLHGDALFALTTQRWAKARLLRIALRDRSVTELAAPPDMTLTSLSSVMNNGRVLLRGLSGWVAVDAATMTVADVLRRGSPAKLRWTDRERSVDYALENDGVFTAVRCDDRITGSSREGVVRRFDLRWNDDHIIALSAQRGVERFSPDGATLSRIDGAAATVKSSLSPRGRWAVVARDQRLVAQDTSDAQQLKELTTELVAFTDVREFALTDDGAVWRWTGRELRSDEGARVAITRRESTAKLGIGPDASRILVTVGKEIIVVDAALRKERIRIAAPKLAVAHLASANQLVVTGSDGVRWFDADSGALLQWHKRRFSREVRSCASADGALLALIGEDGVIELIVRDDPARSRSFRGAERAQSVAFSPDQSQLVVASTESVLRVFSVESVLAASSKPAKRARQ
ncbi:MAG: hypothetical protein U0269_23190 [Polyangiales bacterium]